MAAIPNSNIRTKINGKHADRVTIAQADGDAIKVELGNKGITKNIYNDVNSVLPNTDTLVVSYTVPVGKKFDLNSATCSGENTAKFTVKINGAIIQVKRSWWTEFNVDFDFREQILSAGDVVEIFVTNNGKASVTFDSTVIGGEYDE
jgi:hypothetical protein